MSLGAPIARLTRHCGQQANWSWIRRRGRAPSTRYERHPPSATVERGLTLTGALTRIQPRRRWRRGALQQSTLLGNSNGVTIHLGVEYTQLLGLRPSETLTAAKILSAFERISADKIEEGYSARAMAGRQQLLEDAKETAMKLIDKKSKAKDRGLDLPYHLVPGALSLLAETEEFDLVLDIGKKMLESKDAGNMKRDILLSMALAKLGQAEYYFSIPNQVAMACQRMKEALELLTEGGSPSLAPTLCKEIEDALETYVPQCILDQLKLPLTTDNMKGRKDAISILKGLLIVPKRSDISHIGLDRHYVKQVLDCLTSGEVLQIIDWTTVLHDPKCVKWYYPGLLLKAATAHIVVGFLQRRPTIMRRMDQVLCLPGKDRVAHVEHVICKLLLGEVDYAYAILDKIEGAGKLEGIPGERTNGQNEVDLVKASVTEQNAVGAKVLPGRNETFAFIKANSDESNDYLSGLCIFVERWLQHWAFAQFRDTEDCKHSSSLTDYFKDRKVQNALSSGGGLPKGLFGLNLNRKENKEASTSSTNGSVVAQMRRPLMAVLQSKDRKTSHHSAGTLPIVGHVKQRSLWAESLGGAILGCALFAAIRHPWIASAKFLEMTAVPSPSQEVTVVPEIAVSEAEAKPTIKPKRSHLSLPLRKAEAEKLVQKWQFAKAEALGPNHEFKYMRRVLADPMLATWMTNIQEVSDRGWFWKYKLDHCKVTKVDASHLKESEGYLDISATLKESAVMYGDNGREIDRYRSRYNVAYKVIQDEQGRWKINHVQVLPHT